MTNANEEEPRPEAVPRPTWAPVAMAFGVTLLLAGVDPYWQGTFVGLIIAGAILLERVRRTTAE